LVDAKQEVKQEVSESVADNTEPGKDKSSAGGEEAEPSKEEGEINLADYFEEGCGLCGMPFSSPFITTFLRMLLIILLFTPFIVNPFPQGGGGEMLCCDGVCSRAFHDACLQLDHPVGDDEKWYCHDCTLLRQGQVKANTKITIFSSVFIVCLFVVLVAS
jgi:hypothetical protein